jgi:thioredoxin-dependent peroxiredoxin
VAQVTLKGNAINTSGDLPEKGSVIFDSPVTKNDLSDIRIPSYKGKKVVLNIFPSIDTSTCATSVRTFNKEAAKLSDAVVLCISADLPFAQARFCGAEGIDRVETLSTFRSDFAKRMGVDFIDGPLKGLCARSVVVLDKDGRVVYTQLVGETTNEPDYNGALEALKKI